MYGALDQEIRKEKADAVKKLWMALEGVAHHKTSADGELFEDLLAQTEDIIFNLLAPDTAEDHVAISGIISKTSPEQNDIEELIRLIKRRGANYVFFFKTVDNPAWLVPLVENDFFKNPPSVERFDDGRIIAPLWWPVLYLQRVSEQAFEPVVEIILGLEPTDNPRVLREYVSIACTLPDINLSLRLRPLIKQYLDSPFRWPEPQLITDLIQKWGCEPGEAQKAAFWLIRYVVYFQPVGQKGETGAQAASPRFDQWEYQEILEKCVCHIAEGMPNDIANILISATANMIKMGRNRTEPEKEIDEDYSENWCKRLNESDRNRQDVRKNLGFCFNLCL